MAEIVQPVSMLVQASNEKPKNPAAQAMGKARAEKLSPERRSQIARKAAKARWAKKKGKKH